MGKRIDLKKEEEQEINIGVFNVRILLTPEEDLMLSACRLTNTDNPIDSFDSPEGGFEDIVLSKDNVHEYV